MKSTQTSNQTLIRTATSKDTTALLELWKLCFTEDPDFLSFFFREGFPLTRTFVLVVDAKVVAAASLFSTYYEHDSRILPISYLYGVCTHPDYQHRGLSSQLLLAIIEDRKASKDAFILTKPANAALFQFYERIGFDHPIYAREQDWFPVEHPTQTQDPWGELTAEKLEEFIAETKNPTPRILWDRQELNYILSYYRMTGGIAWKTDHHYLIASPQDEEQKHWLVLDTNMNENNCRIQLPVAEPAKIRVFEGDSFCQNQTTAFQKYALALRLREAPAPNTRFTFPME